MAESNQIIEKCFEDYKTFYNEEANPNSITYSAIKALANLIKDTKEKTYQGLLDELDLA